MISNLIHQFAFINKKLPGSGKFLFVLTFMGMILLSTTPLQGNELSVHPDKWNTLTYSLYQDNAGQIQTESAGNSGVRMKGRWSFGMDLADTLVAFLDASGVQIPISFTFGYDIGERFQVISNQNFKFPVRGGYIITPSIGLRVHSNTFLKSFTAFLSADIGYTFSNVPWVQNGLMVNTYIGSRYIAPFPLYAELGIGGGMEILSNTMKFKYFLNVGYIL